MRSYVSRMKLTTLNEAGASFITTSGVAIMVRGAWSRLHRDRFNLRSSAVTNRIGSGVAAPFIASWQKTVDREFSGTRLTKLADHQRSARRHPFDQLRADGRSPCIPEIAKRPSPFHHDDPPFKTGSENRCINRFTSGDRQVECVNAVAQADGDDEIDRTAELITVFGRGLVRMRG